MRSPRSFEAEPSTPRPTCTPASSISRTGATPGAEAQVRGGAVGDADAVRREAVVVAVARRARSARTTRRPPASRRRPGTRRACSRSARWQNSSSSAVSARCVCSRRPRRRASAADSSISWRVTENGEHGATAICSRSPSASAATRSVSARISSIVSTSESGGRPPCDSPRSIEPREATKRRPSSRAACSSASRMPVRPRGKT